MTRLADEIRYLITQEGPISVARYMELCLSHPRHGYYMTRDPLGTAGDFTTAPEISQMFGELLGLWAASLWDQMGRPSPVRLIELGPGRGTLMADVLRAARALPPFRAALSVHLVEISPVLRQAQQQAMAKAGVMATWHQRIEEVPTDAPALILANEFFDALPIHQFVATADGWRERLVGLDDQAGLTFGLGDVVDLPFPAGAPGDVREVSPAAQQVVASIGARLRQAGGALLAIDYGYAVPQPGDSLQAMRHHAYADVLAEPGAADLTAHVDFTALGLAGRKAGLSVWPLLTQGCLLLRLGLEARSAALAATLAAAAPQRIGEIEAARRRLSGMAEGEMGGLFKALCLTAPGLDAPPAFEHSDPAIARLAHV